jgi:hypothetical protein
MPARPGTAFGGFVQTLMHEIALGMGGYPSGVLWGTQDFKGPSVRAEFAQADRVNTRHQGILCDKLLDPIKTAVIIDGIARGELEPPPRTSGEDVTANWIRATRGVFRFPPRLTIDVGRESQARITELLNGAGSLQEVAAEDGKDAYTRLEEKAQTAAWITELATKYKVPETAIILPGGQLPSTPAAAAAVGEGAGEAAAVAQASSVPKQEPTPEPARPKAEMSVREAMERARRPHMTALSTVVSRASRIATMRARAGSRTDGANGVHHLLDRMRPPAKPAPAVVTLSDAKAKLQEAVDIDQRVTELASKAKARLAKAT